MYVFKTGCKIPKKFIITTNKLIALKTHNYRKLKNLSITGRFQDNGTTFAKGMSYLNRIGPDSLTPSGGDMKFNTMMLSGLIVLLLVSFINNSTAKVSFAGDVTGVSTYMWRGVKQYSGPALQGTASFSAGPVLFGLWTSSMSAGDIEVETDPYLEVALPTGSVTTALGVTVYSYDLFETFNADADYEYEVYGKVGYGPLCLAAFFVPGQSSTENTPNESDYWLELSGKTTIAGADLGLVFGYGTYTARYLATPKKDAVSTLVFSAGKGLTDNTSIKWNYSLALDDDMDNCFWLTASYGF